MFNAVVSSYIFLLYFFVYHHFNFFSMATEAEANRESKAKLIAAKSERKASESLLAAAEILNK